jgi:AcrR family transcriptional regulator
VDVRTRILSAAEDLLDSSLDGDIGTREVCEAAGVGAPALYRHFGDKAGLLAAVVDYGFDRYLAVKRARPVSADPVTDLRTGWDTHVAFARTHPAVYRMMYSPTLAAVPAAAEEALGILRETLRRCAAAGRLRVPPDEAAQAIMAGTVGVALCLVSQPATYTDPGLSARVRDALHAALLLPAPTPAGPATRPDSSGTAAVATQLAALLGREPSPALTAPESALLHQWLTTLSHGGTR